MSPMPRSLRVLLHNIPVGTLTLGRDDSTEFRLLESYKNAFRRPVLGQCFLDDPERVLRSRSRVAPWFSNLLPEGALRDLVARQSGVHHTREFFLLAQLGEDLPGAVRIISDDVLEPDETVVSVPTESEANAAIWHFSLAGVQLKFSATRTGRGLTIPVTGLGGDWIVKLPDQRFADVPLNEFATMSWARASGIDTTEIDLIAMDQIAGLPAEATYLSEDQAFITQRFDRPAGGERVHIEDFAQVLDIYPEAKYEKANYETLGKLILVLAGEEDFHAFIRRVVFMIAVGNGDAHLKNWSLIYSDQKNARLAPAYDLVSTIQYLPTDQLALNLGRTKRWEELTDALFRRMAQRIGYSEALLLAHVEASLERIADAWEIHKLDLGYSSKAREVLTDHMRRVPLLRRHFARS